MTDWMWCMENPKEAAAEIDKLRAALLVAKDALERDTGNYSFVLQVIADATNEQQ